MKATEYIRRFECCDEKRIVAVEVVFTKELVDKLLSINIKNRPIIKRNVEFFEKKIDTATWARGAVVATINESMTWLLDSQHHLIALKNKGYPALRGVVKIVPDEIADETFTAMDCGSPRGLATMLGVCGVTNYAHISSAIIDYNSIGVGFSEKMSPDQALELIDELKESLKCIPIGCKMKIGDKNKRIPSWVNGTLLKILHNNPDYKDYVVAFVEELKSGNFSSGSALHGPRVIREGVLNGTFSLEGNSKRIALLKALDAYCNGRDMSVVWKRIEPSDGLFLGNKYLGMKIDVLKSRKHIVGGKGKK